MNITNPPIFDSLLPTSLLKNKLLDLKLESTAPVEHFEFPAQQYDEIMHRLKKGPAGIYYFEVKNGKDNYIGRAQYLPGRIKSYFSKSNLEKGAKSGMLIARELLERGMEAFTLSILEYKFDFIKTTRELKDESNFDLDAREHAWWNLI